MSIRYARLIKMQCPRPESGMARRRNADEAHLRCRHGRHQGRGTCLSGRRHRNDGRNCRPRRCRHPWRGGSGRRRGARGGILASRWNVRRPGHQRPGNRRYGDGHRFRSFHRLAARRRRRHRHRRRRRHLDRHRRHAHAGAGRPQADGLDARFRRHRALCRRVGHRHDAVDHRHGRPEPHLARGPAQRRPGRCRHGRARGYDRRGKTLDRADHVRRHHALRHRDRRNLA